MNANCGRLSPPYQGHHPKHAEQSHREGLHPRANSNSSATSVLEFNVLAITDEIYEHILYDGARHVSMATLDGMRERTITINGLSKTYSVTGWRVGWAVAPPAITDAIRKVHDFLTVGAPAPLQEAGRGAGLCPRLTTRTGRGIRQAA